MSDELLIEVMAMSLRTAADRLDLASVTHPDFNALDDHDADVARRTVAGCTDYLRKWADDVAAGGPSL
jgi:hypothetical protein